ncbi:hypothetical protein J6590_077366 [Homalodisca vitripennis]|nr:hypothetical protein J6590_077366 [Homalodisca vitripennis]
MCGYSMSQCVYVWHATPWEGEYSLTRSAWTLTISSTLTLLNNRTLTLNTAHPITRYQMEEDFKQPKQTLKKNVFSVSLQAAKYRNACKVDSHSNQIANTFNVQTGPPVTAKLLGENESLKFFTKNIEDATKLHISFFSITNPRSLSTPGHQMNCQTREPFLAQPSEKKTKFKTGQL